MSASSASPRLVTPNRNQLLLRSVDVEELIPDDHPARAIWDFAGSLDLSAYVAKIKSVEGRPGRPAIDPQLLVSIWSYAITQGEGSAREIERLCGFHPAYQWLTGMEEINHHTLSDFRIDHGKELDELFTQVIAALTKEDLVTLERVTQDGTKIKACASAKSFRQEKTIEEHLEEARKQIEALGDPRQDPGNKRREIAKLSALKERLARLEKAKRELPKIQALKRDEEGRQKASVSETDPEARFMRQSDGGLAPSYNVQLTVDGTNGIIVNVGVSQAVTDNGELDGAMEKTEERTGIKPEQVVADGGYTNHANIMSMAETKINFIGSFKDTSAMVDAQYERRGIAPEFRKEAFQYDAAANKYICPAGKELRYVSTDNRRPGTTQIMYRATAGTCATCPLQEKCGGMKKDGRQIMRIIEHPAVVAFHERMETPEAKAAYKTRSKTAEFPNAWFKDKFELRQFHVRGIDKVKQEALWAGMTYNIQQWIRRIWRPQLAASTG